MAITKAVIAVAGYGTRRLPVAKAVEKCMLPLLNRPTIDYVVAECIGAGVTDIAFVVGEKHEQLKAFFSRDEALENYLQERGKTKLLESIGVPDVRFEYIVQGMDKYGTSIPLREAREWVGDDPFYYLGGDSFIYSLDKPELKLMREQATEHGARAGIMAHPVPKDMISQYGAIVREGKNYSRIIEHPDPEELEEYLVNTAIYLLDNDIWPFVEANINGEANHSGEYFAIDIINEYAKQNPVYVYDAQGDFLDCGNVDSWLYANQYLASL